MTVLNDSNESQVTKHGRNHATGSGARLTVPAVVALTACAFASTAGSQSSDGPAVEPVIVTGSHLPLTPANLAQSVSVVDSPELRQQTPAGLEEVLGRLNGVYVDSAGGTGGFTSLYLRGGENSHLMVQIDGVNVNDPTTTRGSTYDLSNIDVSQVERIELLRGPASAVHGAEALAGVLNIVTRPIDQLGFSAAAYGGLGEDNFGRAGITVAGGSGQLRGRLAFGVVSDGESGDDAELRLNTISGYLRFGRDGGPSGELFFRRAQRDSAAFPDDSGGPRLAVNRRRTTRDAEDSTFGGRFNLTAGRPWAIGGSAWIYEHGELANNAYVDPGVRLPVPAFTSDSEFRRRSLQVTATRDLGAQGSVVAGIEYQAEQGRIDSLGDFFMTGVPISLEFSLERSTFSLFVEGQIQLAPPVSLQLGVRRDEVDDLGAVVTPHLGVVWALPDGVTSLKASYSEGFKPPSFFALGFPIGANPDLRPESSRNGELGIVRHAAGGRSQAQISVFQTEYGNLVDFDATTFTYVNRGQIIVRGIEPALSLRLGRGWKAEIGATWLDIDLSDGMAPLRNRPERTLSAALEHEINDQNSLFVALVETGDFTDRSNPTGDIEMPGFTRVDAGYSMRRGRLRFNLAVDNVLDAAYEQYVGFPAQDRRVRVEVQVEY